jgi:Protein of unknown function (DUF3489)
MSKTILDEKSAAPKPTDAQLLMMRAALRRDDRCLSPTTSLRGAKVAQTGEKLIAVGLAREIKAKVSYPVWRRDAETNVAFALKLTAAGAKAAAAADTSSSDNEAGATKGEARALEMPATSTPDAKAQGTAAQLANKQRDRAAPRPTSKLAGVVALLSRSEGARLTEVVTATGWLAHTARAALTELRKRGYTISLDRSDRVGGSIYRIEAKPEDGAGGGSKGVSEAA